MNPSSLKLRRTGKLLLLCAVVCASHLYGMEPASYKTLPPELRQEIINIALAVIDREPPTVTKNGLIISSLDKTIEMLRKLGILHGVEFDTLFNLKDFTKLMHILANKFNVTTADVALKFNQGWIARQYLDLGYKLLGSDPESPSTLDDWIELIKEDADVNFSAHNYFYVVITPLNEAIRLAVPEAVELLLNSGAKVRPEDLDKAREIDYPSYKEAIIIEQLLEEAWEKQHKK